MNAPASITITPVRVADLLAEDERMPVYVHVIDHPDARVLVDTGITELHPAAADLDPRLRPLSEQDVDLAGIDIVVNTHLHFDHCGGNHLFAGKPVYVQRRELDDARSEDDYTIREWVDAHQDARTPERRLRRVMIARRDRGAASADMDGVSIFAGITLDPCLSGGSDSPVSRLPCMLRHLAAASGSYGPTDATGDRSTRSSPGMTGWPTVGLAGKFSGGTMAVAFPGESAEYRAARNRLLDQEIELRRSMEAVADARRRLPPGGVVPQDYAFQARGPGGDPAEVRLSELFAPGKNSLVIYSMMFPRAADDTSPGPPGGQTALLPLAEGPCPSCTALLDQLDGAAEHVCQHVNLAVAAKAPLERLLTFASERGWRRLRLLSSAGSTYNRDYLAETADGSQQPMLNAFHRDGNTIRHFWGSELFYAPVDPGQEPRHVGTIEPLWNLLDFTPRGPPGHLA